MQKNWARVGTRQLKNGGQLYNVMANGNQDLRMRLQYVFCEGDGV